MNVYPVFTSRLKKLEKTLWYLRLVFFGVMVLSVVIALSDLANPTVALILLSIIFGLFGIAYLSFNPLILVPQFYWRWLKSLRPFVVETFWGQVIQESVAWTSSVALLVLGALIGQSLVGRTEWNSIFYDGWTVFLTITLLGVSFGLWSRFLFRLTVIHWRGFRDGVLPCKNRKPLPAVGQLALWMGGVWFLGIITLIILLLILESFLNGRFI